MLSWCTLARPLQLTFDHQSFISTPHSPAFCHGSCWLFGLRRAWMKTAAPAAGRSFSPAPDDAPFKPERERGCEGVSARGAGRERAYASGAEQRLVPPATTSH